MTKEELLYNYFSNNLTEEQQQEFNNLLEKDAQFKAQFDFEKNLKESIAYKERQKLKAKLKGFESERKMPKSSSKNKLWLVAASITILVSIGWYFYNNNSSNLDRLYASYYEKYPNTIYSITRDSTKDTSLEFKAFEAYEANGHQKSIVLFTELKESKNPEYIDFYLAQSYLNNDQVEKAILIFNDINTHKKEFSAEALWYLSLAYLKTKRKERAVQSLKQLIDNDSYKKEEATILLKKLH